MRNKSLIDSDKLLTINLRATNELYRQQALISHLTTQIASMCVTTHNKKMVILPQ